MEDLPGIAFSSGRPILPRYPALPEVLLGKDVGGDLRPERRDGDALLAEDQLAVRVSDLEVLESNDMPVYGDSPACVKRRSISIVPLHWKFGETKY